MYSTSLYRLLDHPYMDIDQDTRRQIAYASPEDRATLAGTIPFFKEHMDAYFEELIQHRLLSQDITINGQSYRVVGRTPDELAQEVARMREEHAVSLPIESQPHVQEEQKPMEQQESTYAVNDVVTVDLYGERLGKIVTLHDPGDGHGLSVEIELDTPWRGGKRYWFEAKEVQPACQYCGTPVTVGIECDGKRYCNEECAKWESALSCGIVPEEHAATAGFNPEEPY